MAPDSDSPHTSIFRPATPDDCRYIAELIATSSDGVALIEWTEEADKVEGLSPIDVGARAYADPDGDYSYRNCVIAESNGRVAGALLTFSMSARETPAAPPPFDGSDVKFRLWENDTPPDEKYSGDDDSILKRDDFDHQRELGEHDTNFNRGSVGREVGMGDGRVLVVQPERVLYSRESEQDRGHAECVA